MPVKFCAIFIFLVCFIACTDEHLPVLNDPKENNPSKKHSIPPFSFVDQDNLIVTEKTFTGKVYVADFIFLSCPTICPKMNLEMLKVYKAFEHDDRVLFISHTIDPKNDSIPLLKAFAESLGVSSAKWHFVTGNVDSIYSIAQKNYFTEAYPDSTDHKNFIHGGGLLLVDKNRHIRGVYDGTDETETVRLIEEIKILTKEQF